MVVAAGVHQLHGYHDQATTPPDSFPGSVGCRHEAPTPDTGHPFLLVFLSLVFLPSCSTTTYLLFFSTTFPAFLGRENDTGIGVTGGASKDKMQSGSLNAEQHKDGSRDLHPGSQRRPCICFDGYCGGTCAEISPLAAFLQGYLVCNISLHLVKLPTFSFQSIISNL